eukprot:m.305579 g.305579  ORF g.305579 m.305579 type:complete len:90 (-) comp55295_c1_seq2:254-523(-)
MSRWTLFLCQHVLGSLRVRTVCSWHAQALLSARGALHSTGRCSDGVDRFRNEYVLANCSENVESTCTLDSLQEKSFSVFESTEAVETLR